MTLNEMVLSGGNYGEQTQTPIWGGGSDCRCANLLAMIGRRDYLEYTRLTRGMRTIEQNSNVVRAARVYLRVSTDEQDLPRQGSIVAVARAAGFYVAAVYCEKASGAGADRSGLLRMAEALEPGEVVIAEKIDRIS